MAISKERLAKLEALAIAATPGLWRCDGFDCERGQVCLKMGCGDTPDEWQWGAWTSLRTRENGTFVAASRTAIPELIEEVRRLQSLLPGWHDRPTGPGLWMKRSLRNVVVTEHDMGTRYIDHWPGGRVFGPIPDDGAQE